MPTYAIINLTELIKVTCLSCLHGYACGTWQFCLHNDEPCGFVTFLCVSVATHVTARGVRVITMKRRIRFGSVRGSAGTEATCFTSKR